jgi:hypothetical protein
MLRVEVFHATPAAQRRYVIDVPDGATVRETVERSGVLRDFPQIDLTRDRVGIHGRLVALDDPVRDGDRVEVLRALVAEPKAARRRRAQATRRPR